MTRLLNARMVTFVSVGLLSLTAGPRAVLSDTIGPAEIGNEASTNKMDFKATVYEKGKPLNIPNETALRIGALVVGLLQSCTDRDKRMVTEADWKVALARDRCVQVVFSSPTSVDIKARGLTTITAILLPIGTGGRASHVLARNGSDTYSPFLGYDKILYDTLTRKLNEIAPKP